MFETGLTQFIQGSKLADFAKKAVVTVALPSAAAGITGLTSHVMVESTLNPVPSSAEVLDPSHELKAENPLKSWLLFGTKALATFAATAVSLYPTKFLLEELNGKQKSDQANRFEELRKAIQHSLFYSENTIKIKDQEYSLNEAIDCYIDFSSQTERDSVSRELTSLIEISLELRNTPEVLSMFRDSIEKYSANPGIEVIKKELDSLELKQLYKNLLASISSKLTDIEQTGESLALSFETRVPFISDGKRLEANIQVDLGRDYNFNKIGFNLNSVTEQGREIALESLKYQPFQHLGNIAGKCSLPLDNLKVRFKKDGQVKYDLGLIDRADKSYSYVRSLISSLYYKLDSIDEENFDQRRLDSSSIRLLGLTLPKYTSRKVTHDDLRSVVGDKYNADDIKLEKLNQIWSKLCPD